MQVAKKTEKQLGAGNKVDDHREQHQKDRGRYTHAKEVSTKKETANPRAFQLLREGEERVGIEKRCMKERETDAMEGKG